MREGCGGRRRAKRAAGTASPSFECVVAMGEVRSVLRHCESFFKKGEAISYWVSGSSEVASLRLQSRVFRSVFNNKGVDCSPSVFYIKVLTNVLKLTHLSTFTEAIAKPEVARPERATAN
ncbi:MAG: hypothetical protein N3F62_09870 [Bacteroidia bacterium]|nr:hypothetical protein [Bacteroidia bacterium]